MSGLEMNIKIISILLCSVIVLFAAEEDNVLKQLAAEDYQVRKDALRSLKTIDKSKLEGLIAKIIASEDPELLRHIPLLKDRLSGLDEFSEKEKALIKKNFLINSKVINDRAYYAVWPSDMGAVLEIGNVRMVIKDLSIKRIINHRRTIMLKSNQNS